MNEIIQSNAAHADSQVKSGCFVNAIILYIDPTTKKVGILINRLTCS